MMIHKKKKLKCGKCYHEFLVKLIIIYIVYTVFMHRDGEWFENKTTTKSGEVFCTNIMMCRMSVKFHFFTFQLRMCIVIFHMGG